MVKHDLISEFSTLIVRILVFAMIVALVGEVRDLHNRVQRLETVSPANAVANKEAP